MWIRKIGAFLGLGSKVSISGSDQLRERIEPPVRSAANGCDTTGEEWFREYFTEDDIEQMERIYQPMGGDGSVAQALAATSPLSLGYMAGWFVSEDTRRIGYALHRRAHTLMNDSVHVLDQHFYYMNRGKFFYRWRDVDENALEEAIISFEAQIGLADRTVPEFRKVKGSGGIVPFHTGYNQMRIIEEKRGNYEAARELCLRCREQGWSNDVSRHLLRLDKKIAKRDAQLAVKPGVQGNADKGGSD